MLNKLKNISSLTNLGKKGQIATLLILIMVAVLVFVLVTVNIGSNAVTATALANAADSGALLLGSQLSSKARVLAETLGSEDNPKTKKCKKTDFWESLLTIVAKGVIMGVLTWNVYVGVVAAIAAYWQETVAQRMKQEAMAEAANKLSEVLEPERFRESVFLQVLSQTIDDPNDIPDYFDSDGNGDTGELVPYFQYWWDRRIEEYAEVTEQMTQEIEDFRNVPVSVFQDVLSTGAAPFLNSLSRQEVESADGSIVELTRALTDAGYDVNFWQPGPTADELDAWAGCLDACAECEECEEEECYEECELPAGYDELDDVALELSGFAGLLEDLGQSNISDLTNTYGGWIGLYYDPEAIWTPDTPEEEEVNADWYDKFENDINPTLQGWKTEIETKRDSLPDSELSYTPEGVVITNSPSKIYQARKDEFNAEIDNIDYFLTHWDWDLLGVPWENHFSEKIDSAKGAVNAWCTISDLRITGSEFLNGNISFNYEYTLTYETVSEVVSGQGTCSNLTITSAELRGDEGLTGLIFLDYEYGLRYDFTYYNKPNGVVETTTFTPTIIDDRTYDIDSPPDGSGLVIPEGTLAHFTAGVTAFDDFVNSIILPFATIDEDTDDEFKPVLAELSDFIADAQDFQTALQQFYDNMSSIANPDLSGSGGTNPVTYIWTDSRGEHSIAVEVGDYHLAKVKQTESGGTLGLGVTYCLKLRNYTDGDRCWVKVTRTDPANKEVGILGKWNPYDPDGDGKFSITKRAKATYSYDKVNLKNW